MLLSRKHGAKFSGEVPWWKYPIIKSKVAHWASPSILCPESALMPQQHQTFSWLCFSWLLTLDLVSLVLETHCLTLSPHFLPKKCPFFPLCFSSLFHWSNVFWQLPVLFQDWPPLSVHVCVCIDFFVCFSHKLPHITFLGQVGNLEGCGKVTFGLWKEMEPAPCTRQASDGPYPWRIHVNVWQNQCSVVK